MKIQIVVTVNQNGQAEISFGGLTPLNASLILSQVCVQLQAKAIEQAGGNVLATAAALPQGIRLS